MNAYIIVESIVINTEKLEQYSQEAAKTVRAFDGEFIAKGKTKLLAGRSQAINGAVIKFESEQVAEAWYSSNDYQALIPLRDQAMNCTFKLVNGL